MTDTKKMLAEFKRKYDELTAIINEAQERARKETQAILDEVFADFFKRHGDRVYAIWWTQGTPSFNDGDECTFSVHDVMIAFSEEAFEDGECSSYGYDVENSEDIPIYDAILLEFKQIEKLIGSIDDDFLKMIYGNDAKPIYYGPNGHCEIEEFSNY